MTARLLHFSCLGLLLLLPAFLIGCTQQVETTRSTSEPATHDREQPQAAEADPGEKVVVPVITPIVEREAEQGDEDEDDEKEESQELPEIGSGLLRDADRNVIPDEPPPPPNNDPSNIYGKVSEDWLPVTGQASWIDQKNGVVIIDGRICRKTGLLEMLICTGGFKEHESIIAAYTKPSLIMAALLAVGAVPGGPAQFEPKFEPAHGTQIDITVRWMEGDEEIEVPAQDLIIDNDTQDVLDLPWVFAGSGFWKGVDGGKPRFQSDHTGDFVCVSNFPSCLLDLPAELSASKEMLSFTPNTELVPPIGTKVRMFLKPRLVKEKQEEPKAEGKPTAEEPAADAKT